MSFSLKREIELYINDVDSTDGCIKLPILPDFKLEVQANLLQVYRKIIGTDPEMLPRSVVDQVNPISLGFMTYLKPAFLDGLSGTTAPEKLLWDSLGGKEGYRGPEYYKPQFGRINRLIPLYIFIKTTNGVYKISTAYVDGVEISFDINYILIAKWTLQAINMTAIGTDVTFTNIKDYTNVTGYIRNKFTKLFVEDYYVGKTYEFPITESMIKIQNVLMPVFDKNVKVVTGTPKDLLVGGRAVNGTFNCYLSSRIGHSKEFLENIYEDLTKVNRKYKITYLIEDEENSVEIVIPNAIINVPNIEFEDVLITNIEFTSTETEYGLNDDIDIKYRHIPSLLNYEDFVKYAINPEYHYKFNATSGNIIANYGTLGTSKNMTITAGSYTWNHTGHKTGFKALYFDYSGRAATSGPGYPNQVYMSYWVKVSTATNSSFVSLMGDNDNANFRIFTTIDGSNNVYFNVCNGSVSTQITINSWNHFAIYADYNTKKFSVWKNNIRIANNSTFTTSNITGDYVSLSYVGGNSIGKIYFSDVIIKYGTIGFDPNSITNSLYNANSSTDLINIDNLYYTDYTDTLSIVKPISNTYVDMLKSYNPKAYWRFNDNGSDIIVDHITGNYPLRLANSPTVGLVGPLESDGSSKAVEFNIYGTNTNQYAYSTNLISTTGVTKQTFCFWVKILSISTSNTCLIKTHDSGTNQTLLTRNTNFGSIPSQNIYNWGQGFGDYTCTYARGSEYPIKLNEWTFITLTIDKAANTVKTYKNGVLVSTYTDASISHVWYWHTYIGMTIGKYSYSTNRSKFQVSEMAYFEYKLPEKVIEALYGVATYTPYSIDILPTSGTLNINSNFPELLRGTGINPEKGIINIVGNVPNIWKSRILQPNSEKLYLLPNKYPQIAYSNNIITTSGNINLQGNSPIIYQLKVVSPAKGTLSINGKVPKLYYYVNTTTCDINIIGVIPTVVQKPTKDSYRAVILI
jgi:hypothetical protein